MGSNDDDSKHDTEITSIKPIKQKKSKKQFMALNPLLFPLMETKNAFLSPDANEARRKSAIFVP
jgi:hypothetical protein